MIKIILGCGCLAAKITLIVYLGIYTFNNPEPQAYYIAGSATTQAELVPIVEVGAYGITPIHDQFLTWFTWMFINSLVPVIILPVTVCCIKADLVSIGVIS